MVSTVIGVQLLLKAIDMRGHREPFPSQGGGVGGLVGGKEK